MTSVRTVVNLISMVMVTAHATTCIDIKARASGQPPPNECQMARSTTGTKDSSSTTAATVRNIRMGFDTVVAMKLNTMTAAVTRRTVSIMGGGHKSGANVRAGCKRATATMRTHSTAATDARTVSGPAQSTRLRMIL